MAMIRFGAGGGHQQFKKRPPSPSGNETRFSRELLLFFQMKAPPPAPSVALGEKLLVWEGKWGEICNFCFEE